MNLLEFIVKKEMNRHLLVGSMDIERNWLLVRGYSTDEEIQVIFDEMNKNNRDWAFEKRIADAGNTKIRILWKRKEFTRINDELQAALHRGELFDTVDIV